jgi:ribosomal protein L14
MRKSFCVFILTKRKILLKNLVLGNFIKVTIKRKVNRRDNIRKRVNWCFVGATARRIVRSSGESLRFANSKVVLLDEKRKKIMGTAIKGVLPREVKKADIPDVIKKARRLV